MCYDHDDLHTLYLRAIQWHCSPPQVDPAYLCLIIHNFIHSDACALTMCVTSKTRPVSSDTTRLLVVSSCDLVEKATYFSAVHCRSTSTRRGVLGATDDAYHHKKRWAVYTVNMSKAQQPGQQFYQTRRWCLIHFGRYTTGMSFESPLRGDLLHTRPKFRLTSHSEKWRATLPQHPATEAWSNRRHCTDMRQ